MLKRYIAATQDTAGRCTTLLRARLAAGRAAARDWRNTARRSLSALGICATAILAMLFFRPDLAEHLQAWSPFAAEIPEQAAAATLEPQAAVPAPAAAVPAVPAVPTVALPDTGAELHQPIAKNLLPKGAGHDKSGGPEADANPREQKWVTAWLAKRYRVASDAAHMLVTTTYSTARELKFDPLLVLAVMAIESGLNPFAESSGGAQGLMQVMSKVHKDKFQALGGQNALNPVANIKVGTMILKDYVKRTGSIEGGLKMYVGAAAFESDSGYGYKVLAEYQRLKDVASGKKISPMVARGGSKPAAEPPQPEKAAGTAPDQKLASWKTGPMLESSGY